MPVLLPLRKPNCVECTLSSGSIKSSSSFEYVLLRVTGLKLEASFGLRPGFFKIGTITPVLKEYKGSEKLQDMPLEVPQIENISPWGLFYAFTDDMDAHYEPEKVS